MPKITYQVIKKPLDERIIDAACIYWNVEKSYFYQKKPSAIISYRKSIIYYLLKIHTNYTYAYIAEKFLFKTHGPVARLIENIEARKDTYIHISKDIQQIEIIAENINAVLITTDISITNQTNLT